MRPVYLEMTAFGPYAGTQKIDFKDLKGRNFFLIHGPTGSGKTTLLDAMCYALYGGSSGGLRSGESMRSDHASPDTPTEVVFDFAVGTNYYRVRRSPRQELRKKRGEGTMMASETAALYRLDDNCRPVDVLAEKATRVTEEIERLLGFKNDQFRQVVLLPQGDFRRLLVAGSTERQAIMQTLFRTEMYRRIEDILKARAAALEQEHAALRRETDYLRAEAGVETKEELVMRLEKRRTEAVRLQEEALAAKAAVDAAQSQLTAARLIREKLDEKAAARQALGEFEQHLEAYRQKKAELELATRAAGLADLEENLRRLSDDVKAAKAKVAELQLQADQAGSKKNQAQGQLEAEKAKEGEREEALAGLTRLESMAEKVSAWEEAVEQAKKIQLQAAKCSEEHRKAAERFAQKEEELKKTREAWEAVQKTALELKGRAAELENWQRINEKRKRLDVERDRAAAFDEDLSKARQALRAKEEQADGVRGRLERLEELWTKGQAAVMAAALKPGTPCPVCGSIEHPAKAAAKGEVPDEGEIKALRRRLKELESEREGLRQEAAKILASRDTAFNAAAGSETELGEYAGWEAADIAKMVQEAQKRYAESIDAERQSAKLGQRLTVLATEQEQLRENLATLDSRRQSANARFQEAQAVAAEREKAVPAEFRDQVALKAVLQRAGQRVRDLKAALETAQNAMDKAREELAQITATLAAAGEYYNQKNEQLAHAREVFRNRLREAGFDNYDCYTAAKRSDSHRAALETETARFERGLEAARERVRRAEDAAKDLAIPELARLEAEFDAAAQRHADAASAFSLEKERIGQEEAWLKRLSEVSAKLEKVRESHRIYGGLYEIACGGTTGISFERFVLGDLLDQVALAANQRLHTMSRGRYNLQRKSERDDRRRGAGLDLEVFDHNTGEARQPQTLSGGETFLASLSLALGLADVVQAYSGGIHLDAIFVDEGFGTLDPETLDFAINALLELQQGGRLVGIISHVPELKERIDARLEISKIERGSRAEFKVG